MAHEETGSPLSEQTCLSIDLPSVPPDLTLDRTPANYQALMRALDEEVQWVEKLMAKQAGKVADPTARKLLAGGPTGIEARFLRFYLAERVLHEQGLVIAER